MGKLAFRLRKLTATDGQGTVFTLWVGLNFFGASGSSSTLLVISLGGSLTHPGNFEMDLEMMSLRGGCEGLKGFPCSANCIAHFGSGDRFSSIIG